MDLPARRTWLAGVVVAVGALVLSTGPLYRVRTWWEFSDPLAADVAVVAVQLLVGVAGIAALCAAGRWRRVDRRMGVVAIALVAWMALGALWSADAGTTLRESVMVGVTMAAGIGAAVAVRERTLVIASWVGIHLGLGWSAVLIATVQPGSQDMNGEWTGVYFNPNSLAVVTAVGIFLSLLVALHLARHELRWVAFALTGAAVLADLWLISGTGALTPLFGLVIGLAVGGAAIIGRRWVGPNGSRPIDGGRVSAVVGVAVVTAGTVAWITRGSWLSAVGRTSNLTGRTDMWDVALEWFWKRPLVGQGYLGAWFDPAFAAAQLAARGEVLGTAHNSFIELLLGTGIVGFGLAIALFSLVWVASGRRALGGRTTLAAWPLSAVVFVIIENLAETLWVGGQLTVAMLGVIIVLSTSQDAADPSSQLDLDGDAAEVHVVGVEQRR
jgi:O-antigen ligase